MEGFTRSALLLAPYADALFVTESPGARPRVSSLAGCIYLRELGLEPVLQLTCIRSNRVALQSELLSAAAWGIHNLLLLGGDPARLGDLPQAADVRCLDTPGLVAMARGMRDRGRLASGVPFAGSAPFFIGVAVNHHGGREELERLRAKLEAGADFVVTQPVFDAAFFARWWEEARPLLSGRPLLAGVLVLGAPRAARRLAENLPGVDVPEETLRRLENASDPAAEGSVAAAETARALWKLPGLGGLHFMNASTAEGVLSAMEKAGVKRRRRRRKQW